MIVPTMPTKFNTPRIFLPTKNTKILPTKFNTRTVQGYPILPAKIILQNLSHSSIIIMSPHTKLTRSTSDLQCNLNNMTVSWLWYIN